MRDDGLNDGGQCEAEDQWPEDLPSHGQRHSQCAYDCIDHPPLLRLNLFVQRWEGNTAVSNSQRRHPTITADIEALGRYGVPVNVV